MASEVGSLSPNDGNVSDGGIGEGGENSVAEPCWRREDGTRTCPHHSVCNAARIHSAPLEDTIVHRTAGQGRR